MEIYFIFLFVLFVSVQADLIDFGGNWTQHKSTKSYKIITEKLTEADAIKKCQSLDNSSTLASIHDETELKWLTKNLMTENDKQQTLSAWIGLVYKKDKFVWLDKSAVNYTNWSDDRGKPGEVQCVQMSLEKHSLGKWSDEPCTKLAWPICQRSQQVSMDLPWQNAIAELKAEMESKLIPIGFLYTQLPGQSAPSTLWPGFKWTEVTRDYAGLFFRAEGGGSSAYGVQQSANCPKLRVTQSSGTYDYAQHISVNVTPGIETKNFYTGPGLAPFSNVGDDYYTLSFYAYDEEVRHVNKAVKIWKRIE